MGTSIKSEESVLALLRHFKDDDGRVALLVKELEELSNRVQTADLATDPRLAQGRRGASAGARLGADGPDVGGHAPPGRPSGDSASASRTSSPLGPVAAAGPAAAAAGPGWPRPSGGGSMPHDTAGGARRSPLGSGSGGAFAAAVRRVRHAAHSSAEPSLTGEAEAEQAQGPGPQAAVAQGDPEDGAEAFGPEGVSATGRVEDAALPVPPQDLSRPLPVPPGGHAWEALQAAANDNVRHFDAAAAKMGWKKWALTKAHSALLVSLFWWVVAAAFRPDHPLSRPVQDFTFGHFCRHYVSVVLRLRGRARDHYQQVWIDTMAAAALYLLAEVFPRSAHKFDEGLRALITKQLRLWTAGALPADLHPSAHADAHSAAPAAFAVAAAAAELAAGQGRQAAFAKAEEAAARAAGPAASSLPSFSGPSFMYAGMVAPASTRSLAHQSLRRSFKSRNAVEGGGAEDQPDAAAAAAAAAAAVAAAVGSQPPQGFVTSKPSPVLARMLAGGGGGAAGGGAEAAAAAAASAPPVVKGLLKNSVGGTLARLHRALDEDSEEDLSYKRHASAASAATSAAGAVAAYEAGRRAAAAEAAAARRGLVEARAAIDAKQRAVVSGAGGGSAKALSDRLSGYIQNDVDRLLAGLPTSTEPGHTAELPRYVRHTASSGAAAAGAGPGAAAAVGAGSASVIKPARLMAPLYEMRRVEGNIRSALAAGRHSSTDTAARVAARASERAAAAAADWRPLAGYPVGTKDTRRRKMAATVLYGLDLDSYT